MSLFNKKKGCASKVLSFRDNVRGVTIIVGVLDFLY